MIPDIFQFAGQRPTQTFHPGYIDETRSGWTRPDIN